VTQEIKAGDFHIAEDRDNFDYVYSTEKLSELQGSAFKKKRQLAQRFKREHPQSSIGLISLSEEGTHAQIKHLLSQWEKNKQNENKDCNLEHESVALSRLLNSAVNQNVFMTCVFDGEVMVGFGIDEILPNRSAISHFVKADIRYKGIYEFINQKISSYLVSQGVKLWNWQQDLGLEGLRRVKLSYEPAYFLKKYMVSRDGHMY
jgi:hypothetical protein